jgi:hypothetical protein
MEGAKFLPTKLFSHSEASLVEFFNLIILFECLPFPEK